jgi:8-oxo-dGTP pyrophosphatase MutT (NUDIX family)
MTTERPGLPPGVVEVVRQQLERRQPVDPREERGRAECLKQLDRLALPFDRDADPTHFTGSGVVLGPRGVLLLLHRKLGIWVQPGGHVDPGEAPWDAARRETGEETGLAVRLAGSDPVPPLLHVDVHVAGPHTHLDLRYLIEVVGDDEPRPPAGESQDVRWEPWPAAIALADEGLAGLLRALVPPLG